MKQLIENIWKRIDKMKEDYKEFVGIYDESVPIELCNEFVEN